MGGPPTSTSFAIVSFERDALLATKLHVPRPRPGFVVRSRLVERLEEGLERGLIVVCAPAGSGKTALLADWVRRARPAVAWLSLDAGDNDPSRFWRHATAALDQVRPGLGERVAPLLGPPPPQSFEGLVTAVVNELAATPGDALLVLDDYHLVDNPVVHTSLGFLLEHLPPGLCLALTSRSEPPLALAPRRAQGRLAELRGGDLRFTVDEAAALLREVDDQELPDQALQALTARTEGWAAGLQLAVLSLRGQADAAGFVARFSGTHRHVLDYLTAEVLDRQPEPVREFLLETSVLERLSGALCDATTGRADGQTMLEEIERANLFLVPLDEVRGWWRYHQLFADMLRARLQRERPGRARQLHRNAATWCEAEGLTDAAVRHALGASETVRAAHLIERHAESLLMRSEGATVARWLAALPAELADSRPRLLLLRARLGLLSGQVSEVEALLDGAERAWPGAEDPAEEQYEPSVGRSSSVLANVPGCIAVDRAYLASLRGDAERAVELASRALSEAGEAEWMLKSHATGYLGIAEWLRGRLSEAEGMLGSTIVRWREAGERSLAVRGAHHLGQVQRAAGRLDAAVATYRRALEVAAPSGHAPLPSAGVASVGLAEVAYERGELDDALRYVTDGIGQCRDLPYTQPLTTGLATLAWIRHARSDRVGALEAMAEAERVAPGPAVTTLLNPVPARRARLLLALGDVSAAAAWTEERGLRPDADPIYTQEPDYLVLARVLLARGAPDQTVALVRRLLARAAAEGRTGSVIELRALEALALMAGNDEPGAVAALAEGLRHACPQGYLRVFVDEGPPLRALVLRLIAAQRSEPAWPASDVPFDCLARVARAFEGSQQASAAVPGLVEQLTAREVETLRLLAAGRSNQAIAEEWVVTLDTVKKHVGHVLGKLGAANRTEAVARARDLGLFS